MAKRKDLTGMKFGRLSVVEFCGMVKSRQIWLCRCECGVEKKVRSVDLIVGQVKSCGCLVYDREDLTGRVFNRWTVLGLSHIQRRASVWLCRCECGSEGKVNNTDLKSGQSKSCGCIKIDYPSNKKHGHAKDNGSRTYTTWHGIIQRCKNQNTKNYKDYGGRGIDVCERWCVFENFLFDMGEKPVGLEIDRIDNNKGYSKENCRWATRSENTRNTRRTRNITALGKTQCITAWAQEKGISRSAIKRRLKAGYPADMALMSVDYRRRDEHGR